jgi:hypothetical protein
MSKLIRLLTGALTAALLTVSGTALAATPKGGTLSKPNQSISWTGTFNASTAELHCTDPDLCDHFLLKLNMGEGARVHVGLPAPSPVTDLDLYVYDPNGDEVASSGNLIGSGEGVTFTHKAKFRNKAYDVVIEPYTVLPGTTYKAAANVVSYVK